MIVKPETAEHWQKKFSNCSGDLSPVTKDTAAHIFRRESAQRNKTSVKKKVDRIGGSSPIKVDIRVIAATHRDLEEIMAQRKLRRDFYFRLQVFPIDIPALMERKTNIPAPVQHFILKK
jgi:sigma54-dependent transcription regulator